MYGIAVDFGTKNIRIAHIVNNKVKVIENGQDRAIPSLVYCSQSNELLSGVAAKRYLCSGNESGHAFCEIKRLIGANLQEKDRQLRSIINNVPFKIYWDKDDNLILRTERGGTISQYTPIQIFTKILRQIKSDLKLNFDGSTKTIVTIPSCYSAKQKQVIINAAKTVGFNNLELIDETEAIAIEYCNNCSINNDEHYMIFKLGAGYCEVAIIKTQNNAQFDVVNTKSITIGGNDFDYSIAKHLNYNKEEDKNKFAKFLILCEEAKRILTDSTETDIILDECHGKITITQKELFNVINPLLAKCIDLIRECIDEANLEKSEIQEVILSGGSVRITQLQAMIEDFFGRQLLNRRLNLDEAAVKGATLKLIKDLGQNNINFEGLHEEAALDYQEDSRNDVAGSSKEPEGNQRESPNLSISLFNFDKDPLGKGAYGRVFKVEHKLEGQQFALKQIELPFNDENKNCPNAIRECDILKEMNHPNVVRLFNYWFEETRLHDAISQNSLFILMELCRCHLLKFLKDETKLIDKPKDRKRIRNLRYCQQITSGLHHIHEKGIFHRDLKPENILLGVDLHLKIGDFGGAKHTALYPHTNAGIGTDLYRAPEFKEKECDYDFKVDIYALGIIFYEILNRFQNFDKRCNGITDLKRGNPAKRIVDKYKSEMTLINNMIQKIPSHRKDTKTILEELNKIIGHSG